MEAAPENDAIRLLQDYTVATASYTDYAMPDNSTLDLGGNTLTLSEQAGAVFAGNNITIQNGRFESNADYAIWVGNWYYDTSATLKNITSNGGVNVFAADAVLEDCTIDSSTKKYYAVWGEVGNVEITIKSGTYIGGALKDGTIAVVNANQEVPQGDAVSAPAIIYIQGGDFTG